MSKKMGVFTLCLFLMFSIQAKSDDGQSDDARIKAVIKQAFITHRTAYAKEVEHGEQKISGKKPSETFGELSEYISNNKGYLDKLNSYIDIKALNEELHFAGVKKWRFKDFDFKTVNITNDSAIAEVDIYTEVTTTIGGTTSTEVINDEYDNVKEVRTQDYPAHDIVVNGGDKHSIKLEKNNNKWQIVWDDWGPLPGYRP